MRTSSILKLVAVASMCVLSLGQTQGETSVAISTSGNQVHTMTHTSTIHRHLQYADDDDDDDDELYEEDDTPSPTPTHKKKKKKHSPAPTPSQVQEEEEDIEDTPAPPPTTEAPTTEAPSPSPDTAIGSAEEQDVDGNDVEEKKIKGDTNEGVIDHSSEGSSEIDKIDLRNQDEWVSVYHDPPSIVIKASLYAFIQYNDTTICDSFNMTLTAVEKKEDPDEELDSYHVAADVDCELNGDDQTSGKFVLNFEPEGTRLLLTECGHREEGEIMNWLYIKNEVPECMTPAQRKEFLSQPMKHVHAVSGSMASSGTIEATKTDFLTKLEDLEPKEVAIAGSATVALVAIVVVLVVFVIRKRRAQRDLERTIAGAKAEQADDDDDEEDEDEDEDKSKTNVTSTKSKHEAEEGSFVNSPAVRV